MALSVTLTAGYQKIWSADVRIGFLAHAAELQSRMVSGHAEADFDIGMRVNLDATRVLLEHCRKFTAPPKFVFTSSVAVFGGPLPKNVNQLVFKASQTYSDGDVVQWIEPTVKGGAEPEHPAPVLKLGKASSSG